MNKRQKEYVRDLKIARKRLVSGYSCYICICLWGTKHEYVLRGWIEKQLFPNISFEGWIENKCGIYPYNSEKLKRTRLAWIDAMIKELEK